MLSGRVKFFANRDTKKMKILMALLIIRFKILYCVSVEVTKKAYVNL